MDLLHKPFDIDTDQLDMELVRQAKLYRHFADKLADARLDYAERKRELEVTEAEVDLKVRSDPEKHGIIRVVEKAISNAVTLSARVKKATAAMNQAKHKVDTLEASVNALEHKKRSIEKLVDLHRQSYWARPSVKGTGKEIAEEMRKKVIRKHN